MKPSTLLQRKWNTTALAFLFPAVGMLMVMIISQYAPFGSYSILYSDMYHQYYPFFLSFRRALLSGDSLLYTWNIGMGMDYLGLISYYLASPLNLLSVLFPEKWMLTFFSLLSPVKLGLAGMFFAIFLKKIFRKDDLSIPLFGTLYALCAWSLGYQWNIMWMDTFALLPLVALGAVSLLRDKKFILYTSTLFLSIYSNYYIGLFICIFVLLLFICYEICRFRGFRAFFADLLRMAVFSALAIGMTAVLTLPAYAALQTTESSINEFPKGFRLNITDYDTWKGLIDAMRQVAGNMNGGLKPSFKEGLPNLYCGILSNILALLYLMSRQVKLRDKLCCVLLLLFFNISFIIRQLDYIWHGFHFTNMIPYRFSFLYSFVVLYMAYKAFTLRYRYSQFQIVVAGIGGLCLAFCSNSINDTVYWAYNGLFLVLYFTVLLFMQSRPRIPGEKTSQTRENYLASRDFRRSTGSIILFIILAMEIILNLINYGIHFTGSNISDYPKGTKDTAAATAYMKDTGSDELFYRAETAHNQTLNDGALNNYNGISTFTSSANMRVTEFMKALGFGAKSSYNRYCYEETSPVANLFLGLKYILERDDSVKENQFFTEIYSSGKVHLLKNKAYLPLGFLANSQLVNVDFDTESTPFIFQNELLSKSTGIQDPVWSVLTKNVLGIYSSDNTVVSNSPSGSCYYDATDHNESTSVTYSYAIDREGFMCIYLNLPKKNSYKVFKNGKQLYSETYSIPQMLSVSDVAPGDVIEIELNCKAKESGNITITAGIMNPEVFWKAYDVLSASTLELTEFGNTRLSGTIECDRSGVLYTSITQNGNWSVKIDDKPAQTVTIGDAMVGVFLSEGKHNVEFSYDNRSFRLGITISMISLCVFLFLYFVFYQPSFKRKKGKYER